MTENELDMLDEAGLDNLWDNLGDIPINDDDEIESNFHIWQSGTDRFEIWHWFDEKFKDGLASRVGM
ncbi:TPA: hypothetical protein MW242_002618 [Acinetobacter baumannii]|nr:hypothetical protein [Acinetobacter baumannii]